MMNRLLDQILPPGAWQRTSGYPLLLDSIRWLKFRGHCPGDPDEVIPYEIDSMAYIFDSLDAV
jgi:hypothetical protein